jgi:hypothetical protein
MAIVAILPDASNPLILLEKPHEKAVSCDCGQMRLPVGSRVLRPERPEFKDGEVPEWSNGAVSKTVVRASAPRVRIPPSPPFE